MDYAANHISWKLCVALRTHSGDSVAEYLSFFHCEIFEFLSIFCNTDIEDLTLTLSLEWSITLHAPQLALFSSPLFLTLSRARSLSPPLPVSPLDNCPTNWQLISIAFGRRRKRMSASLQRHTQTDGETDWKMVFVEKRLCSVILLGL